MLRKCTASDHEAMQALINDAARAFKGVIPEDRWHEPYMSMEELQSEIQDGVKFQGIEQAGRLAGVMGIQDKMEVTLIRHAYVRTASQGMGLGRQLLRHLEGLTHKPILIGTWQAATWAIRFYEKNGYVLQSRNTTRSLLRRYWIIPDRQIETSVVLANWRGGSKDKLKGS